ncbi:TlpA family protein disulfide reductase [Sphingobacterium alkalisoli]|uniref:TlpA family protein disulfide reductase n=1 Tax=Sphingobacterium alkalisoli TaxID=1874115 RepID=UPI00145F0775|nr:TlpA disulfide reductase family protein [Sphingobacterium alkalisoli]
MRKSKREPRIRNRENAILSVGPALSVSQSTSSFLRPISYISWSRLRLDFGRATFLAEAGLKPEGCQQLKMQKTSKRRGEERQKKVRTTSEKNTVYLWSTYQKATVSIRVTYQKYTLDLLKTYQRLTKKLPTRYREVGNKLVALYRNASDNLHAFGSLTVASLRRSGMLLSEGSAVCCVFILCFVVLFSDAQAQFAGERAAEGLNKIKPLEIGDRVPEELWEMPLQVSDADGIRDNRTLNDYRGKLIILDFWATWCKSCIEGFPKLDKLKAAFGEDIQFLLVNSAQTKDTNDGVLKFFERYKANFGYVPSHPLLIGDTIFQQLFPHDAIPHFVWIDPSGKLKAVTHPNEVNVANIRNVINGRAGKIHQKTKIRTLADGPKLFVDTTDVFAASALKPYVEGLRQDAGSISVLDNHTLYQVTNNQLNYLCALAFSEELRDVELTLQVFDDAFDPILKQKLLNPLPYDMYCFQVAKRSMLTATEGEQFLRAYLQHILNLTVERKVEEREVYVVEADEHIAAIKTKGSIKEIQRDPALGRQYIKNVSLESQINDMRRHVSLPIVVKYIPRMNVDLYFPENWGAMPEEAVIAFYADKGLILTKEKRTVELAVFRKFYNN